MLILHKYDLENWMLFISHLYYCMTLGNSIVINLLKCLDCLYAFNVYFIFPFIEQIPLTSPIQLKLR